MMKSVLIVLALVLLYVPKKPAFDLSTVRGKSVAQKIIMAAFGPGGFNFPCQLLRNAPRQQRRCFADLQIRSQLQEAAKVSKNHCQEEFRFNPWGCSSLHGNINFVKHARMYRETAVLYAMYSAALVQTVSRACANGHLERCSCSGVPGPIVQTSWQWETCGDNFAYGRRFTRRFLQLSREGMDPMGNLVRHNSEVGIRTVAEKMDQVCKCHGISGSCSMRTCWSRLREFKSVAHQLKFFYHSAELHTPHNNIRSRKMTSMPTKQLFYLEKSPSFCSSTHGRECENPPNCATLCCGRGYVHHKKLIPQYCKCRWRSNRYTLNCSVCNSWQETYNCK